MTTKLKPFIFTKEIADGCKPKDLKPGDKIEWVITWKNQTWDETQEFTLCDVIPADIFSDPQIIEEVVSVPPGETFELIVTATIREDLCPPCTFTNVAEAKIDKCHSEFAIAEPCIIGEECDLKYNPEWGFNIHEILESLLGVGNDADQAKIIDWINKCNTLADLAAGIGGPSIPPELDVEAICEIVIAKLTEENLTEIVKQLILDCITNPETSPITKALLADVLQGPPFGDDGILGEVVDDDTPGGLTFTSSAIGVATILPPGAPLP